MTESFEDFRTKQDELKQLFSKANTPELTYQKIIELGQKSPSFPEALKTPDHLVQGCQSTLYLNSTYENDRIFFQVYSDALITSGLAYILQYVYSGLPLTVVLKSPPKFLDDLNIAGSLSPTRANGLSSLFLKMQQEALKYLIPSTN